MVSYFEALLPDEGFSLSMSRGAADFDIITGMHTYIKAITEWATLL